MKAPDILARAKGHIEDRAAARDKPEGERSMARTVAAFNAITGHALSERDGWLFMVTLKQARACNTSAGHPDDFEDMAAYAALAGESVSASASAQAIVATVWRHWDPYAHGAEAGPDVDKPIARAILRGGDVCEACKITSWGPIAGLSEAEIIGYKLAGDA